MKTLQELESFWSKNGDIPSCHQAIYDSFTSNMESDCELLAHREHVESRALGMGCRAFSWMWKLVIDAMPNGFSAIEIGVYQGQTITLWELLASRIGKPCSIVGVSTFDGREVNENGADYYGLVVDHFDRYNLTHPTLIRGSSTDQKVIDQARKYAEYDIVYIDGGHTYDVVTSDILTYAPMLKVGGLLFTDDSANRFHLPPCHSGINFFHGIEPVSQAVDSLLPPIGPIALPDGSVWEHIFVCMHIRAWRKLS